MKDRSFIPEFYSFVQSANAHSVHVLAQILTDKKQFVKTEQNVRKYAKGDTKWLKQLQKKPPVLSVGTGRI